MIENGDRLTDLLVQGGDGRAARRGRRGLGFRSGFLHGISRGTCESRRGFGRRISEWRDRGQRWILPRRTPNPEDSTMAESKEVSRRRFLKGAVAAAAAPSLLAIAQADAATAKKKKAAPAAAKPPETIPGLDYSVAKTPEERAALE